jgi:hypothetical protein
MPTLNRVEVWCDRHSLPLSGQPHLVAVPGVQGSFRLDLDDLRCTGRDTCRPHWVVTLR